MSTRTVFVASRHDQARLELCITSGSPVDFASGAPAIIIAHPYGPLGGDARNNIVSALHRHFAQKGYTAVSLNFRGSGQSEGKTSWTAMAERDDYESVIEYILNAHTVDVPKVTQLVICGYSFGSMIAASLTTERVPTRHLLISYPFSVLWALATTKAQFFRNKITQLLQVSAPGNVYIVYGDQDQFTGAQSYKNWLKDRPSRCIQDADHFWMGMEEDLLAAVDDWETTKPTIANQ